MLADNLQDPILTIQGLNKTYTVSVRSQSGIIAAIRSLFNRKFLEVHALNDFNWQVNTGSIHALIGSNGSGKSTTVKILTGILTPTSGKVNVMGFEPWTDRSEYVKNIGAVFGQKSQLAWELPAIDTYALLKEIYRIPTKEFKETLQYLVASFDVEEFIRKPVRNLSLGERMKCEIICALLHRPKLVFLDEPTIGLDMLSKEKVRKCIKQINRDMGTTFILTSHDLSDIEHLCNQVSIIDHGKLLFDSTLENLLNTFSSKKVISIKVSNPIQQYDLKGVNPHYTGTYTCQFEIDSAPANLREKLDFILEDVPVIDINIQAVNIETIVRSFYLMKNDVHEKGNQAPVLMSTH